MAEMVTLKSKYLEIPQELRDKLIKLHNTSKSYKRDSKAYQKVQIEDIDYREIRQEVKMAALRTEEVRRQIQTKLNNLEEIREYTKAIGHSTKDGDKKYLLELLKKELNKGEEKLAFLEQNIKLVLNREREENVLQNIQTSINRLSEQIEQLK
ncbi:hypothetical protein NECID01_2158 [Nematocida sp. AWRm77]|nr:hypothetical protein NECID01_2158 [Nematocida sp. AWRm77]